MARGGVEGPDEVAEAPGNRVVRLQELALDGLARNGQLDPAALTRLVDGVVTAEHAASVYGVVFTDDQAIDDDATEARRAAIRAERKATSSPTPRELAG